MRLSKDDRYELARAALKAPDLKSLRDYIISVVDAFDDRPEGKTEVPCPRYVVPATAGGNGEVTRAPHWEETLLA